MKIKKNNAHQKNIVNNSRLKVNARVVFHAETSDKGLVANNIELDSKAKATSSKGLSDRAYCIR
jgi:hypothetical protein